MRIVLTGGGTGGHLTPLIAVANALRRAAQRGGFPEPEPHEPLLELLYVGIVTDVDRRFLEAAGIPYQHVPSGKIRRYLQGVPLTAFDLLVRLPLGIFRGLWALFFLMPDVVFSKGGYGSIPTVFAAWVYRIPVLLHETDLVPGLANQRLARFASAIAVGFRDAERSFPAEKVFVSGTPLREIFEHLPDHESSKVKLGLHDRKPVLFITGGSQGAQRVNTAVLAVLPQLLSGAQVLHQVGEKNLPAVREFIEKDLRQFPGIEDYHVVGFLSEEDMALSLAAADLVVSRAGGTALAEISAAGKASLLIPLHEAAQRHQWENAYFFREEGAAAVLDETNLSPAIFLSTVQRVLNNPQDLKLMAERMRSLFRPGAAEDVAATLLSMARGQLPRREAVAPSS